MKVTVVGAGGNVGSTVALSVAQRDFAKEVIAVDLERKEDDKTFYPSKGRALDQWEASPIHLFDTRVKGTTDYADTANSDVCVITAGVPRRPGMSRDDLLEINANIVRSVTEQLVKHSPDTIIIVVSNPLDVMVQVAKDASGLPYEKVMGMAGILDTARYRAFIAEELDVSPKDIQALLMGGHGDTMVPMPRFTKISGKPLLDLVKDGKISSERVEEINQRTRDGGAEIVKYLEKGSAFYAPAASGVQMAEAYLNDQKKLLPCAVQLNGEYGVQNVYAGVPVIIGKDGVEKIEEIDLDEKEKKEFMHSIDAVKALWEAASKIDPDLSK